MLNKYLIEEYISYIKNNNKKYYTILSKDAIICSKPTSYIEIIIEFLTINISILFISFIILFVSIYTILKIKDYLFLFKTIENNKMESEI